MYKFIRNRWYIILTILALLAVIGWSTHKLFVTDVSPARKKVSVIVENSGDSRWDIFKLGVDQAGAEYGLDISYITTGEFQTLSDEKAVIDSELSNGNNGIIISFCADQNASEVLQSITVPVVLVETDITRDPGEGNIRYVIPDYDAMGRELANSVVEDYGDELKWRKIAVLGGNQRQTGYQKLLNSFSEVIVANNGTIIWTTNMPVTGTSAFSDKTMPDIVVALDDISLQNAAYYNENNRKVSYALYGVGNSPNNVYCLDNQTIKTMIFPNDFAMGYQSVVELLALMNHSYDSKTGVEIDFAKVRNNEIYVPDNEKIIFPMGK